VLDIRTIGLCCGIDLASRAGAPGLRAYEAMERGFHDTNVMIRVAGDTLALSPPLVVSEAQIGEIFDKVGQTIKAVA
jgi:beta-alanine--pyruvate transaminase